MLTTILLAVTFQATVSRPKWFDTTLAGYAFAYDATHSSVAVYDPKTHFVLVRVPECDGADMTLLLTRDRYMIAGMGYRVPDFVPPHDENGSQEMTVKAIPSLKTKHGITIGASISGVRSTLGAPSKTFKTGARKQFVNMEYAWSEPGPVEESRSYSQTYTFKQGKLIEILFSWWPKEVEDKAVVRPQAQKTVKDPKRGG